MKWNCVIERQWEIQERVNGKEMNIRRLFYRRRRLRQQCCKLVVVVALCFQEIYPDFLGIYFDFV